MLPPRFSKAAVTPSRRNSKQRFCLATSIGLPPSPEQPPHGRQASLLPAVLSPPPSIPIVLVV